MMRGGLSSARWIDAENYHLTLRFIGDIDAPTADAVDEVLSSVRRKSFMVTLEGLGYFGGDKPRAIIAKVQASPALVELQAEQERLLRRIGLPPEPRRFVPHVTLARMRNASQDAVAHYLGTRGFLTRRFEADGFNLYSARDSVGGGPYVIEAAKTLG